MPGTARLLTGLLVLAAALVPALTTATAGAQTVPDVQPIVECSFLDPGTGMYNTVWGYQNRSGGGRASVTIQLGETNRFDNPAAAAGQPTVFKPGRAQNAFIVTHKGSSTWSLTGKTATAPGAACKTNPVPIAASGLPGIVTLVVVTLALGAVLWWRSRRARRA